MDEIWCMDLGYLSCLGALSCERNVRWIYSKCGIEHVLANLMYGPMLYEWNLLEIICLDKLASFSLKYKCLKATFLFFLSTLDEVDFLGLLEQETKLLLIIILESISPSESVTNPSKRVIILTLLFPFFPRSSPIRSPRASISQELTQGKNSISYKLLLWWVPSLSSKFEAILTVESPRIPSPRSRIEFCLGISKAKTQQDQFNLLK